MVIFVKAQNVHFKDATNTLSSFLQTIAFIVFKWRKNHTPALKLESSTALGKKATHENAGGEEEEAWQCFKVTLGVSEGAQRDSPNPDRNPSL